MSRVSIVMDASQYDMFRLCEARYNYRYNYNRTLATKAKQLDRGTIVHLANEVYYQGLKDGLRYEDARVAALSKIREAGVVASDLEPEEIARIVDVMEEYYDYWRIEDQNLRIEAVEQPFIYKLYEDDDVIFHLAGKIDLLYSDNRKVNVPMDHKTRDRESEVLRMTNQFRNYCYALGKEELIVNIIGFQKTLKAHEKFKRPPVSYDKLAFDDWKENVVKVMFYYLRCAAEQSWPMNETSCDKYHRKCEYYDICDASGKPAKMYKLKNNFIEVEPWDVSKVLRKSTQVLKDEADASSKALAQAEETEVQDR